MGLMDVIGDIGKSALGLGSDYAANKLIGEPNAAQAWAESRAGTAKQFERNKEMFQNRYQWTMKDMKAAGLNPILALSKGGINVGTAPQVSAASGPQAVSPYGAGASSAKQFSESKLAEQKSKESEQNVKKMSKEIDRIIMETKKGGAEIKAIGQQIAESKKRIISLGADIYEKNQRGMKHGTEQVYYSRMTEKLETEITKIKAILPKLEAQSNIYRGTKSTKNILTV